MVSKTTKTKRRRINKKNKMGRKRKHNLENKGTTQSDRSLFGFFLDK